MTGRPSAFLRIGFLSPHNPHDRRAFSGTAHYAAEALRANPRVSLKVLGSHRSQRFVDKVLRRASHKLARVDPIEFDGLDAVVGLVASELIDGLKIASRVPLLHVTDATPCFLREAYGWDIPGGVDSRERRVVAAADKVIYSSDAMAFRAAQEFGVAAAVVPFGINLDTDRLPQFCPEKPVLYRPQLLFVGNDWARKGGDIAVTALQTLRARGIDAHLTIVGRMPHALTGTPHITGMGYLDKNRREDAAVLARLYTRSHLLLLPSRADCTPMVAAEAMAHGTPVLASDTGGVSTLIGGPACGCILPLAATGTDWARAVEDLTNDHAAWHLMSDAAFDRARTRLGWSAWVNDVLAQIDTLRAASAATNRAQMQVIAA